MDRRSTTREVLTVLPSFAKPGDRVLALTASAAAPPETSDHDGSIVGTIDLEGHVRRLRLRHGQRLTRRTGARGRGS